MEGKGPATLLEERRVDLDEVSAAASAISAGTETVLGLVERLGPLLTHSEVGWTLETLSPYYLIILNAISRKHILTTIPINLIYPSGVSEEGCHGVYVGDRPGAARDEARRRRGRLSHNFLRRQTQG